MLFLSSIFEKKRENEKRSTRRNLYFSLSHSFTFLSSQLLRCFSLGFSPFKREKVLCFWYDVKRKKKKTKISVDRRKLNVIALLANEEGMREGGIENKRKEL